MLSGEINTWPRTPEGYCACPYCAAIRDGGLPSIEDMWADAGEEAPSSRGLWRRRMEGGKVHVGTRY